MDPGTLSHNCGGSGVPQFSLHEPDAALPRPWSADSISEDESLDTLAMADWCGCIFNRTVRVGRDGRTASNKPRVDLCKSRLRKLYAAVAFVGHDGRCRRSNHVPGGRSLLYQLFCCAIRKEIRNRRPRAFPHSTSPS